MRTALFLSLLCFFSNSFSQQLAQLHLLGQPEKSTSEIVTVRDVNGRYCSAIQVISDLEGFSYQSYNGVVKVDHLPGQDMVYVSPDERVLEIYHSGYEPLKLILLEVGIRPAGKEVWRIKIAGARPASQIAITILSQPEGAEITLDGEKRGSDKRQQVSIGSHELHLSKAGFQPVIQTIVVDESHTLFECPLKPQEDVTIRISSLPEDAAVYIDGVKVGQTPVANFYAAGRYRLRIEKERYVTFEDYIDIQPPRTVKSYTLNPDFGDLTVTSSPESGLEIYLDGQSINARTPHTLKEYKAGSYRIKAKSDYYETDEQEIVLGRGEKKNVVLSSAANFATLTVITTAGATVYLNDKKLESYQNVRLSPAVVVLRAEMAKAAPVEKRIALRKGETQTIEMILTVPSGTIQVAAIPELAKIELSGDSGEQYSATGDNVFSNIPVGIYKLTVSLNGYTTHSESITLKEGERIPRSIKLMPLAVSSQSLDISATTWRDPKTGIEFVLVKGGTFDMGDTFGDGGSDEKPVHRVTVRDFYLGKTEVTVAQYRIFCQNTGRSMPDAPLWGWHEDHPMVYVDWEDATAFCKWAGYRLPTEAEWEYAAREGGRRVRFGNGKEVADPTEMNFDGSAGYKQSYSVVGVYRETTVVGSFAPNSLGLYDMSGNVWELCQDWYADVYYAHSPSQDPQGPSSGKYRVLRGGSWYFNLPYFCRASIRYRYYPDDRVIDYGFRVVRPLQ